MPFLGDMLVPWRVHILTIAIMMVLAIEKDNVLKFLLDFQVLIVCMCYFSEYAPHSPFKNLLGSKTTCQTDNLGIFQGLPKVEVPAISLYPKKLARGK